MIEDMNSRVASLEAYSKVQHAAISELKRELRHIRSGIQEISSDLHAAKVGGRVFLAVALTLGGLIGWIINMFNQN